MFDAPFVAEEDKQWFGNTGIEVKVRCRMFGFVMNTGGTGMHNVQHDCVVCVSLQERFGTCEYMHQANPSRCTCWMTAPRVKTNVQSVLQTASTDRARLRYWRQWSLTEGIKLGLTVLPQPAPNLFKTDGKEGSSV
jgi:hypothetical protein